MTTFTTEDRLIAEQNGSVTINVEPIPFAGMITLTESVPKYRELTDFEIKGVMALDECWIGEDCSTPNMIAFARAILRKAQEK
jgi:hypothetical protein